MLCPICKKEVDYLLCTNVKHKEIFDGKIFTLDYAVRICYKCKSSKIKIPPETIQESIEDNILKILRRSDSDNEEILLQLIKEGKYPNLYNYDYLTKQLLYELPNNSELPQRLGDFIYARYRKLGDFNPKKCIKKGQYNYISKNRTDFWYLMDYIRKKWGHRKHFIDVGSGFGDKVLFADAFNIFDKCTGIEYKETYHAIAEMETLQYCKKSNFIRGDAFTHNYSPYDTVYLYCPLKYNSPLMYSLYSTIWKDLKKGSIMIEAIGKTEGILKLSKENNLEINYISGMSYLVK